MPKTIKKSIRDLLEITGPAAKDERGMRMTERERKAEIDRLEKEMRKAAQDFVDDIMRRADEGLTANLGEVRKTRAALKQQIPSAKEN